MHLQSTVDRRSSTLMRVSAGQPFGNSYTIAISRLVPRTNVDVSLRNRPMFANYFVSKIDSLKTAITSQLTDIALHPLDPVCSHPSMQLEPVTSLEVSELLSVIPPKSCLDDIPTAIIKQCFLAFSDLIAYLTNLFFSQVTFPSQFNASVPPLLKKTILGSICLLIFDLSLTSITFTKLLKGFFLHVCNYIALSHLSSILCSQLIANIFLLKPLSFIYSIHSFLQLPLPPHFSLFILVRL